MCEELKLIQTHLGVWKLEDWQIFISAKQLNGKNGIYCVKNLTNGKLLIGEGKLCDRLGRHINGDSQNKIWKKDLEKYGKENFRLIWIIEENDEIQRKLIENKLQLHFKDNCYNLPRRKYPTQKELINNQASPLNGRNTGNIVERLNNYTKVQRNYINECWESNYKQDLGYGRIVFENKQYQHHILMYIINCGDICGISSTIHHKCENRLCVNPNHLEVITHVENIRISKNTEVLKSKINQLHKKGNSTKEIANKLNVDTVTVSRYINFNYTSKYRGVRYKTNNNAYESSSKKKDKSIYLGYYKSEIHAAQNRDYYIVKNNLLHDMNNILNFHNIDYYNFVPHKTKDGKINKNLC